MDIATLKKLGLSDKEIKTFLKLLEYGAISVRGLAELTGLNRGTTYDILKKLQGIGLVSYYHQETKQRFVAEEPGRLIKLVQEKEDKLKQTKAKLVELIPELKSLQDKGGDKPTTKFYEGKSGIRFILDDILETVSKIKDREYFVYSAEGVREDVYSAYPDYNKKRIKNKIKASTISLSKGGGTYGLDERKWLLSNERTISGMTYILIYASKCAFISRDAKNAPVGVIIENEVIYETQKVIFLQLWKFLRGKN
jgi:sugar-specific transcriptional regulator TrmB